MSSSLANMEESTQRRQENPYTNTQISFILAPMRFAALGNGTVS